MLYLKALHIIGVVVWFSGLFYIGRLFIYHQEASERPSDEKQLLSQQFALMEKRLWYMITWPGCVIATSMGLGLLMFWGFPPWVHIKLLLVLLLLAYHLLCGKLRRSLERGTCRMTSKQLRLFNEVPSLLLIAIVFIVVLKDQLSLSVLGSILLVVSALIVTGIGLRKKKLRQAATSSE